VVNPTVADFKAYFVRDFPYGTTLSTVIDSDIQKGIDLALINFNEELFGLQADYTTAYLYLAAHYLVTNLRASSQGLAGSYAWLTASKSVGSVNESFQIPQYILDHPMLGMLTKTTYGAQYLFLVLPRLVGQIFTSAGATHA